MNSLILQLLAVASVTLAVYGAGDDCDVCIKTLDKFRETLEGDDKTNMKKIEASFKEYCKKVKGKEERFCYYLGATEISATYTVNKMTEPLSWGMPSTKVCEKLKKLDPQICDLKYDKSIDLKSANLKKMRVKELKKILDMWGEYNACRGCTEKSEYVAVVEKLMEQHDPESYAARKAAQKEL